MSCVRFVLAGTAYPRRNTSRDWVAWPQRLMRALHAWLRLCATLGDQNDKMQACYDSLATFLSEATVAPESFDRRPGLCVCESSRKAKAGGAASEVRALYEA